MKTNSLVLILSILFSFGISSNALASGDGNEEVQVVNAAQGGDQQGP